MGANREIVVDRIVEIRAQILAQAADIQHMTQQMLYMDPGHTAAAEQFEQRPVVRPELECDPEISAAEIETMVMKLPQMLLETAPLLARSEQSDDMPTTCLSFDA